MRVGPVTMAHRGAAPALPDPVAIEPGAAAQLLDLDGLLEASQADAEIRAEHALMPSLKAVRGFIRNSAFADAGRIWGTLAPLFPDGAGITELAEFLDIPETIVSEALALLDGYGAVEFLGEGDSRAVRIAKDMR